MFNKVLVANRGEIACRIISTLREMDIPSVAIYSEADEEALHVQLADEAICIGGPKIDESYQNPMNVLNAALVTQCDAIHPGYGFLSEKADFADLCEQVGITFIGPSSHLIEELGDKQAARQAMASRGVPVIPGSDKNIQNLDEAYRIADSIGYPVMIKSAHGGGGRGMRQVESRQDMEAAYTGVLKETQMFVGDSDIYIEKIISPAKHVEVQILADAAGKVIHLGTRDCSLQRNHQKVLEIAPAQALSKELEADMCESSVKAMEGSGYVGLATIEYLVDDAGNFYFLEMNTRLQVEHTITEEITGLDLVKEQIKVAAGLPLSLDQEDIHFNGVAIEARVNAEAPLENFRPSSGRIGRMFIPSGGLGVRVDHAIYPSYLVPPFYDSLLAKVIVHRPNREEAFATMKRSLNEVVIEGIDTNVEMLESIIRDDAVLADDYSTNYLEHEFLPRYVVDQDLQ